MYSVIPLIFVCCSFSKLIIRSPDGRINAETTSDKQTAQYQNYRTIFIMSSLAISLLLSIGLLIGLGVYCFNKNAESETKAKRAKYLNKKLRNKLDPLQQHEREVFLFSVI